MTHQLTLAELEAPPWWFTLNEQSWPQDQKLTMEQVKAAVAQATKDRVDIDAEALKFSAYWQHRIGNRKVRSFVLYPRLINWIRKEGRDARRAGSPRVGVGANQAGRGGGFADPRRYE